MVDHALGISAIFFELEVTRVIGIVLIIVGAPGLGELLHSP
jgi:hypothetical protein